MKALYFDGKNAVYTEDYPKPARSPGHSLIRVLLAAVCNTDREVLKGYRPDFQGVLGHEFVGIVENSCRTELVGKRVVGELNEGCGKCIYCRTGREKHCTDRKVIGMHGLDGTFAEYFVLADHLIHPIPDTLSDEQAIYTEPLAAALEIPNQLHIRPEQNVALVGDGRLSYMIAQVIALTGADLTIIGKHPEKLKVFEPFGRTVLEPQDTYEVVIDATGSPSGIALASKIVRRKGTIVLKSTYAGVTSLNLSELVVNEITVMGSRCGPFEPAIKLLERKQVNLPQIELWELSRYQEALDSRAFKVGFRF